MQKPSVDGAVQAKLMSKKIVVPEGMLKAAIEARYNGKPTPNLIHVDQVRVIVEAALLWLSDNPIVPTDEQCEKLSTADSQTIQEGHQEIC